MSLGTPTFHTFMHVPLKTERAIVAPGMSWCAMPLEGGIGWVGLLWLSVFMLMQGKLWVVRG